MFKSVWNIQCLYTVPKRYNRDILACVYSLIMYNCLICLWNIFRLYDLSQVYFSTSCFLIYQSLPQWDSKSKLARSNTCTFSLFFLPVSRFLFGSGMHDLSVFYVFFHKVITLKVSPRIRSLLLIRIVILPLFFLSFFFICLFTRSSLRHRVLKRQTATVRLGEIWLRTSFLLHFYIFIPPSYK